MKSRPTLSSPSGGVDHVGFFLNFGLQNTEAKKEFPMRNSRPPLESVDALHFAPEWWRVVLASIGDAVIITDVEGKITFLNPVAESLTGWTLNEAADND